MTGYDSSIKQDYEDGADEARDPRAYWRSRILYHSGEADKHISLSEWCRDKLRGLLTKE